MTSSDITCKPSLILMGSKPGSVVALEAALRRGWDVRAVVVSKENPHPWLPGRHLAEVAQMHGLPVYNQADLPKSLHADLLVSYMFRHLVKPDTLVRAKTAALNFHPAPLPGFGGWAFYNVAILEGASSYGCTCHYMDDGFDTGDLCFVNRFSIDSTTETAFSLEKKAQLAMIATFVKVLRHVETGAVLPREKQNVTEGRYMDKPTFEKLKIIPEGANAEFIDRTSRAFFYPPYPGASMMVGGVSVEILPEIAKRQIVADLHARDHSDLTEAARAAEISGITW